MIDLRSQLLGSAPGAAENFDEGVRMCRLAAAEGVRASVAAVRWAAGASEPPLEFDAYARELERLRAASEVEHELLAGFVLSFHENLPALVAHYGQQLALAGGRSLLVALPALEVSACVEGVWDALKAMGFRVVVARPECSPALRRDAARLDAWVANGVTVQLDAASVTGAHGREALRFARRCAKEYAPLGRLAIASNACDAGPRRPSLKAAFDEIARTHGPRVARSLVSDVPRKLLEGGTRGGEFLSAASRRRAWGWPLRFPWGKTLPEES